MKYFLILSLILNFYMQFSTKIFETYLSYEYCDGGPLRGYQSTEFEVLGINLFHIPLTVEPTTSYGTVECMNGKTNKK